MSASTHSQVDLGCGQWPVHPQCAERRERPGRHRAGPVVRDAARGGVEGGAATRAEGFSFRHRSNRGMIQGNVRKLWNFT